MAQPGSTTHHDEETLCQKQAEIDDFVWDLTFNAVSNLTIVITNLEFRD